MTVLFFAIDTLASQEIEGQILKAIKHNLLTSKLVAEFTQAYQEEINRLVLEPSTDDAAFAGKHGAIQRKIAGILRAIEDGLYQFSMMARLS